MPSLYESTVNTGEVSSSNFTTLYNASGLSVPNAGAGSVTGNLNVGGNLTVQGNSLLIGEVTLQSTLSLPNYQFPLPDGSTFQVLVTDGNGNLYWDDVSAIPGADYNISATTATGGANLTLANTAGFTDNVKFAAGTNMSIVRTDANTITISTVADNIPDGTARGQVLYWNGSAWTASSSIRSAASNDRLLVTYENSGAGTNNALFLRKDYGATNYSETNNDGVGLSYSVTSTAQGVSAYGNVNFEYSATDPQFVVSSSTDNFATNDSVLVLQKSTANLYAPNITLNSTQTGVPSLNASITVERGSSTNATLTWNEATDTWEFTNDALVAGDLAVNGGDITTTAGTGNLFNTNATTVNIGNGANTEVNIGSPTGGSRVQIKPDTIVGISTTQAVFNTVASTVNAFGFANTLNMGSATSLTTLGNNLDVNGEQVRINANNSAADSYLYMKGSNEYLKWNNTDTRFEFSDQIYNSQTDIPAIFERRNTTSEINTPLEFKSSLRLMQRVTDAPDNDTTAAGPGITFSRTSGATDETERIFASLGSVWDGATQTVDWGFNWSNDDFAEPTPGNFPGSYRLLRLGSNNSEFYNDSIYIDYSAPGTQQTATSITGGNTLVFGSAHGFSVSERIKFMSTTQNGLTQDSFYYVLSTGFTTTQCQIGITTTSTPVALTNGTGLSLAFAELVNQVGINTNSPDYTLDVDGDANVSGDIYVSGVHVDLSTPVHQGQLLYVSDDVTPTITNSSLIPWNNNTYRLNFQGDNGVYGRTQTAVSVTNNTGAVNYTTGDGSGLLVGVDSDSQSPAFIGTFTTAYDTTGDHEVRLSSSTNNFANDQATSIITSNTLVFPTAHNFSIGDKLSYASPTQNGLTYNTAYYVIASGFTTTQCQVSLTLGGSAVTLTNGTGLSLWFFNNTKRLLSATSVSVDLLAPTIVLNSTNTGIPGVDAGLEIERGTSGANATFKWIEANTRWEANASIYTLGNLVADGPNIQVNADSTAADSFLYMKGTSEYLKWNNTDTQFEFSDDLEVIGNVNATSFNIDGDRARLDTGNSTTWLTGTNIALTTTEKNVQKAIFYITDGTNVHTLELLALRTGTGAGDAMLTTYGEMYSSTALATFTAEISGSALRIRGTNTTATTLTVSILSTTLL